MPHRPGTVCVKMASGRVIMINGSISLIWGDLTLRLSCELKFFFFSYLKEFMGRTLCPLALSLIDLLSPGLESSSVSDSAGVTRHANSLGAITADCDRCQASTYSSVVIHSFI